MILGYRVVSSVLIVSLGRGDIFDWVKIHNLGIHLRDRRLPGARRGLAASRRALSLR